MVTLDPDNSNLTLDAALTERRTRKITATKHPIEVGAKPIDHSEIEPDAYVVHGIFSGVPIAESDQSDRGLAEGTPLDTKYITKISDALDALFERRDAITIVTELNSYQNMLMTSLDMPRDASTGFAIEFTATFEEVHFVQTQSTTLQQQKGTSTSVPKKPNGTDKQGKKVAQPVTNTSWAKSATDAVNLTTSGDGIVPGSPGN